MLEKTLGNSWDNNCRSVGRLAQMRPTLISMEDQVAAGELSNVGSVEFEIETRDLRRRIDTMQTLEKRPSVESYEMVKSVQDK